eukprot:TRINITY_DN23380_c0_g1_i1.p1 TRINITY_DN23380_c0_g1~~TRINITY_DN23380_c0_g1_i1.p1  ORF type:complete len:118 (+),score=6.73 TRINITY_DN23380_c0_g1_i1:94-447(+)
MVRQWFGDQIKGGDFTIIWNKEKNQPRAIRGELDLEDLKEYISNNPNNTHELHIKENIPDWNSRRLSKISTISSEISQAERDPQGQELIYPCYTCNETGSKYDKTCWKCNGLSLIHI